MMNTYQKNYYHVMARRNRLIPIRYNGKLCGALTFFICFENERRLFNRTDMWNPVDDTKYGDTIYIDHLIVKGMPNDQHISFSIWKNIKKYFKTSFPEVEKIQWNRWKRDQLWEYTQEV